MIEGGRRIKGNSKSSTLEKPLITVITVVYNGVMTLEKTIQSVVRQTYDNIEYIIIDGSSTDGTLDIIKKYEDKIDYWQSDSDKGIYDAMNKGIMYSTGSWINFMNSGDCFSEESTVDKCFRNKNDYSGIDIIYGDSVLIDGEKKKFCLSDNNSELLYLRPCYRHGASFVRGDLHRKNYFDLSRKDLGYALDYNLIYSFKTQGFVFKKIPVTILDYEKDGISNDMFQSIKYNYLITKKKKPVKAFNYYMWNIFKSVVKTIVNMI